jgi:hypothetical protein
MGGIPVKYVSGNKVPSAFGQKWIFLNLGNCGGFPNLVNARINLYRHLNVYKRTKFHRK